MNLLNEERKAIIWNDDNSLVGDSNAWDSAQPDLAAGTCVAAKISAGLIKMSMADCSLFKPYICQTHGKLPVMRKIHIFAQVLFEMCNL